MGADFSRVRLNPLLDYAGVELKQGARAARRRRQRAGRRSLDRRLRALASDVLGPRHGVVDHARRLQASPSRAATLHDRHGPAVRRRAARREPRRAPTIPPSACSTRCWPSRSFADPIAYDAQPYLPNPPALPTAGRHLVYLDVWQREVTHLEQPDLVEIAVGVDTTSRLQTVWQVRVLAEDAGTGTTCASPDADIPGWSDAHRALDRRLTTGTFEVARSTIPASCRRPAATAGSRTSSTASRSTIPASPAARATFKWSRENASVGSRVASMVSAHRARARDARPRRRAALQDRRLGRDHRRRARVLAGCRRDAQASRSIEATRRITVHAAAAGGHAARQLSRQRLPRTRATCACAAGTSSGAVFRTDAERHAGPGQDLDAAGSTGVITVPAAGTTLLLENGVTVSFASTGAKGFRAGDYWVFAARTADASVELLDRAPPRGIHHHYARLGIWDVGAGTRRPTAGIPGRRRPAATTAAARPASRQSRTPAASSRSRTR